LFRRASQTRTAPSITSALFCLAIIFPAFFLTTGVLSQVGDMPLVVRLAAAGAATALLFGGIPLMAAWMGRDRLREAFQLTSPHLLAWPAAILLGLALWPLAHELVVWQRDLGIFTLSDERLEQLRGLLESWRSVPLAWLVLSMAIAPGVFEEFFFRGYLFRALRDHSGATATILASAILFGLFHLVTTDSLAIERLLPSTLMGLVLGWLCWRTRSVLPGMLLHSLHNGFLVTLAYYEPALKARGIGVAEQSHLPASWLLGSLLAVSIGVALVLLAKQDAANDSTASLNRPPDAPPRE
jgi:ABC-2 type transport system permease protein/sodium transport system permease protein